ncbi:hypothetical protein [uncultured Gimesia sp.]|uniref:hypothetical protein n=1 Tax=uncultured Gimesia sp. TaxID=1678688 RepID=UPI00262E189C|nr:hypothetical protein [uncultured Gimesia sp.]
MPHTEEPTMIQSGAVYTLDKFKSLSGLGTHAMRQAVKKGLQTVQIGSRKYVRGSDFLAFIDRQLTAEANGKNITAS